MAKWNIGAFLRSLTKGAETETPPPAEQAEASQNILTEEMGPVAAESTAVRSELKGSKSGASGPEMTCRRCFP